MSCNCSLIFKHTKISFVINDTYYIVLDPTTSKAVKPTGPQYNPNMKLYPCTYCPKKFLTNNNLIKHTQKHTGDLAFKCNICSKSFSNKTMCLRHEETHSRVMVYECDICKTEYTNLDEFRAHRNTHDSNSPFKCDNCFKTFNLEEELNVHKQLSCGKYVDITYTCQICDKKLRTKEKLERHMLSHNENKGIKCTYNDCEQYFTERDAFMEHAKIHTEVKNYECKKCDKKFSSDGELKEHENTHSGIMSFECMLCSKSFVSADYLDDHLLTFTHSDELLQSTSDDKPFKCNNCQKSYMSKSALKLHEDIHKNEMYSCKDCSLMFNSRSSLYRHIKVKHRESRTINLNSEASP